MKVKSLTYQLVLSALLLLMLITCIEPYSPEINDQDDLLVVEAVITDNAGSCSVKLSRSYAYNQQEKLPETKATVLIVDSTESTISLKETQKGYYQPEDTLIRGEAGHWYQLRITTSSGEEYASDFEYMKSSPPIDSIYYTYKVKEGSTPYQPRQGVEFYVNTYDPFGATQFYRWEWQEYWEFNTQIPSYNFLDKSRCWQTAPSTSIVIANSLALSEDRIQHQLLHFVDNTTERLKIKYGLVVRQYALSEKEYKYWNSLEQLLENGGTLFDPIPSPIYGNIKCTSHPEKSVLGYFQVSGVSSQTITVDRNKLPNDFHTYAEYMNCAVLTAPAEDGIQTYLNKGYFYIDSFAEPTMNGMVEMNRFARNKACFDCTVNASNRKPEFWDKN